MSSNVSEDQAAGSDGLLSEAALDKAAACLRTMAHPLRLRIVDILARGDYCVRDIASICGAREHQVCEHLRLMQVCGLLTSERRGRSVHYKIASPQLPALLGCIRANCGLAEEQHGTGDS